MEQKFVISVCSTVGSSSNLKELTYNFHTFIRKRIIGSNSKPILLLYSNLFIANLRKMFSSILKTIIIFFHDKYSVCTVFGKGPLWILIKVKWAHRVGYWSSRISVFMRRNTREISILSLCLCLSSPPPQPVRTQGEASLGRESSYQNLTLLAPWSGTSSPQNCEEIFFCCLMHWSYGILLRNSKLPW